MENGETFLLPFWCGGHHEYLYFRPMSNQDWYLCTAMPYGVVESIAAAAPERVAYVSCNPATWARDVARFESQGYRLTSVQPVDMFPQTYHVEVVSVFERL